MSTEGQRHCVSSSSFASRSVIGNAGMNPGSHRDYVSAVSQQPQGTFILVEFRSFRNMVKRIKHFLCTQYTQYLLISCPACAHSYFKDESPLASLFANPNGGSLDFWTNLLLMTLLPSFLLAGLCGLQSPLSLPVPPTPSAAALASSSLALRCF